MPEADTATAEKPLDHLADAEKNITDQNPGASNTDNHGNATKNGSDADKDGPANVGEDTRANDGIKAAAQRDKDAKDAQRAKEQQAKGNQQSGNQKSARKNVGDFVMYALTEEDATAVALRRAHSPSYRNTADAASGMHKAHEGPTVIAATEYPMLIVSANDNGTVNGQVFVDGNDTLYVQSVELQ